MQATTLTDLEVLEQILEISLHAELLPTVPLQVRCLLRNEVLMVVLQHPEPMLNYPRQVFRTLERMLAKEKGVAGKKVIIYLRLLAEQQPYAFHTTLLSGNSVEEVPEQSFFEPEENEPAAIPEEFFSPSQPDTVFLGEFEEDFVAWQPPLNEVGFEVNEEVIDASEYDVPLGEFQKPTWLPLVIACAGIGIVVFLSSFYALTRPCVIGECTTLIEAQQLAQASAAILAKTPSGQEILRAEAQLEQALKHLQSIPFWSRYHTEAQDFLKTYRIRRNGLEEVVEALKTAARAAYASQNAPLSVSQWENSQALWREAIARLELVAPQSEFYGFAQEKLPSYRDNLTTIQRRLREEQQAQQALLSAQQAAEMAQARQKTAISLSNWELVEATWQTAVNDLESILQGTTAYGEAQELLSSYIQKLVAVRDRKNQESFALDFYNQGIETAQLAKRSEAQNEWSNAVDSWRMAIASMEQIPPHTFLYSKARPLLRSYNEALSQAQIRLHSILDQQRVERDLQAVCAGTPAICDYTLTDKSIRIRLAPVYMQQVTQAAVNAEAQNDANAKVALYNQILALEQALKAISVNTGLSVELYNPDGALVKRYD